MIVSVEKPSSPSEIVEHHGIKGMKWGVRKESSSGTARKGLSTKKKVAIGVGVTAAAVGTLYVAHRMSSSGKLPILEVGKAATGRSGQTFVSNLSHAQWDQKIANVKATNKALDMASRSMVRSGLP